jgi:hypothetical protein
MKSQGLISIQGQKAVIRFRFSPQRFAAIKKVRGALFDREQKVWIVPLGNLPAVTALPEFDPREVEYQFDTADVAQRIETENSALAEAFQRITANPFSVTAEDIERTQPDIVFRLNEQQMLRARLGRKSRAKRLVEALPGAHYIRKEQSYFFPAQELTEFIKKLRDKQIRFAVEATASERLKRGSLLRAHLAVRPGAGSAAELAEAMLFPFLDATSDKGAGLRLVGWTTEQLRDCFPHLHSFSERKTKAHSLSAADAAQLLYRARAAGIQLWVSKARRNADRSMGINEELSSQRLKKD